MLHEFHWIRPYWLSALLPLAGLIGLTLRKNSATSAWNEICDPHLLPYLLQNSPQNRRQFSLLMLLLSAFFMIIALSGPSWSRFPVPTYKPLQPRVILLDMSETMLEKDLLPNRLSRAKFKLHDLFAQKDAGQLGLIVYTGEPFVASPLTDDSKTIDALLPMLSPDIMPVEGHQLSTAFDEASRLFTQAGFYHGDILVMTSKTPSTDDVNSAKLLSSQGFKISVMPIVNRDQAQNPLFERLAYAGGGEVIPLKDTSDDLAQWLHTTQKQQGFSANLGNDMPIWRDQGRLFIIPALLLLLPIFRRGWLQGVST